MNRTIGNTNLTIGDLFSAGVPPTAAVTLGQINEIIGAIGGIVGIAYLLWKWRREARKR